MVVIAHDVDPIELVVWLPALCRKMDVPYVIVKSKARLGHLVHKKTTSVLAITEVRREDVSKLEQITAVRWDACNSALALAFSSLFFPFRPAHAYLDAARGAYAGRRRAIAASHTDLLTVLAAAARGAGTLRKLSTHCSLSPYFIRLLSSTMRCPCAHLLLLLCVYFFFLFFQNARLQFNDNTAERRRWGGGIMGSKAQAVIKARERAVAREAASKA